MRYRRFLFTLCVAAGLSSAAGGREVVAATQVVTDSAHTAWVVQSLKEMLTIKPGMTREQLLAVPSRPAPRPIASAERLSSVALSCRSAGKELDLVLDTILRSLRHRRASAPAVHLTIVRRPT